MMNADGRSDRPGVAEHWTVDWRVVRLIHGWLKASVLEDGSRTRNGQRTPQGGSAPPLLGNISLHYLFHLSVQRWRWKHARGDAIVVRYADDVVVGFQYKSYAKRFRAELAERFSRFALKVHPDKTRVSKVVPFAPSNRKRPGQGKHDSLDIVGFTHACGEQRSRRRLTVPRDGIGKRFQAKLRKVKTQLPRRSHDPVPQV